MPKKAILVVFSLVLIVGLLITYVPIILTEIKSVTFADKSLDVAIKSYLNKAPDERVTKEELAELVYIDVDVSGENITDLSWLQYCSNLTELRLVNGQIIDISPLATLTDLQKLTLASTQIGDISALASLSNLRILDLSINQISDISPLASLTNIEELYLHYNQISDISPLASMTRLKKLLLGNNQISDISPLSSLSELNWLFLGENQIQDISPLASLTNLEILWLKGNPISDIRPLASLTNLKQLTLTRPPEIPRDWRLYNEKGMDISFYYPPEWGEVIDYVDYIMKRTTGKEPKGLSGEEKEAMEAFVSVYEDSRHYGHYLAFSNLDMDWATHIRITSAENIQSFISETNKRFASLPETIQERSSLRYLPLLGFWGSVVLLDDPSLMEQLPQNVRDIAALPEGVSPEELKDTAQPVLILFANGIRYLVVPLEETWGQIVTSDGKLSGVTEIGSEGFDVGGREYWDCILTTSDGERLVYISFSIESLRWGVEELREEQQIQFIKFTKSITLLK